MSDVLTRGGQLSLHSLRMFKQVVGVLFRLSVVVMVGITIAYLAYKVSLYDLKVMYWYTLSSICMDLGSKSHLILIEDMHGKQMTMSAIKILTNPNILAIKNKVVSILVQGLAVASYICAGILAVLGGIFLRKGIKFSRDEEIRGGKLVSPEALKQQISRYNKKHDYEGYRLAGVSYPAQAESVHTLIAGSTGSGKTVVISDLINQIKKRGDRAIIFDKMGVYTERFYDDKTDTLLNPFDKRSPNWSIFKEVGHEASFDAIANALIPLDKGNADPFWIKAARTLFSEVCCSLLKKGGVTNKELVNILLKKDLAEAAKLIKGTAAQAIIDEKSPKTALSVMAILATYLKCLKFLKDEGKFFSIKEWVKNEDEKGCIFITSSGDFHSTLTPLISAWLEISINNLLSLGRSHTRKIWIILDELPSLHTIPSLEQGLAETRQFGGCFVLSIQSISQLRDRYGMNGSQTLSSLCNNKVFLRAGDHDSARWYSDNIGTSEVEELKESLSYGAHETRDGVNINRNKHNQVLVLPSELINLKDREGYFCMAKGFPIAKVSFEYNEWLKINERLEEILIDIDVEKIGELGTNDEEGFKEFGNKDDSGKEEGDENPHKDGFFNY